MNALATTAFTVMVGVTCNLYKSGKLDDAFCQVNEVVYSILAF